MIEAYEIGIKIAAVDNLSKSLTSIISKLQKANKEVLTLSRNLTALNKVNVNLSSLNMMSSGMGRGKVYTGNVATAAEAAMQTGSFQQSQNVRRAWGSPIVTQQFMGPRQAYRSPRLSVNNIPIEDGPSRDIYTRSGRLFTSAPRGYSGSLVGDSYGPANLPVVYQEPVTRRAWSSPSLDSMSMQEPFGQRFRRHSSNFGNSFSYALSAAGGYAAKGLKNSFVRRHAGAFLRSGAVEYGVPLALGYGAYRSVKDESDYQYLLASVSAIRGASPSQMDRVNSILQSTSSKYGFNLISNARIFQSLVTGSALSVGQISAIYPGLMKGADAYRFMHPGQNPMNFVELAMRVAHATGNYAPSNLKAIRNAVLGFTATTDVSSSQAMSALTYSIKPGIMAFGDTPSGLHQYFSLMSTFSRQGRLRTLGGRNFADFFINTMRPTSKSQVQDMIALGLWGPSGSTVVNSQGNLNLPLLMSVLNSDKSKFTPNQLMSLEYGAYGKQAGLIVNTMTSKNFNKQYKQAYNAQNIKSLNSTITQNTNTLMGQFQIFSANMSRLMQGIGSHLEPAMMFLMKDVLNPISSGLADLLGKSTKPKTLAKNGMIQDILAWGDLGANPSNLQLAAIFDPGAFRSKATVVNTHVHLDGRKIAESVSKYQSSAMTGEQSGPTHYNFLSNFTPTSISRVI